MSSADFRRIAVRSKTGKEERLFRAAVSAFCALARPTRREIAQLEELTLPHFDLQPKEAKRFAAAALSEAARSPNALIRRLCDEPVDVAAPLLIRSEALGDVDLIALIGRHGVAHARAIARRENLHPSIAALVRALEAQQDPAGETLEDPDMPQDTPAHRALRVDEPASPEAPDAAGASAERMRERLRAFMAPASAVSPQPAQAGLSGRPYARLKMTALSGNPAFFQTALADALDVDFSIAREIATSAGYTSLLAALKVLDLTDDEAFLVAMAVFPAYFAHTEAVRLFVQRYGQLDRGAALDMLRGWRAESAARSFLRTQPAADNSDAKPSGLTRLRAS